MRDKIDRAQVLYFRWPVAYAGLQALVLLALGAVFAVCTFAVESKGTGGAVVKTAYGSVRGETEGGVLVFRGIRFAAPPVGSLRFHPPAPPTPWTEIRPALDFAPACPQLVEIDPTENNNSVMAEDCLAVNVWTPRADAKKRPVMVWIHGGAFIDGSARNTWYDGATLAQRGDVVVVTLQYRMGVFGFLELAEIGGKQFAESGNLGMLDQIAALRWVQQNIAAFGGNPGNVTIFGESAGSASVGILMATPAARGLFHKAIMESGAPALVGTAARAAEVAREFMKVVGANSVEQLRGLSMVQMRDAQKKLFETRFEDSSFGPVVDGSVLQEPPMQTFAAGRGTALPVLIGTNLDEMRYWSTIEDLPLEKKPQDLLEKQLAAIVGSRAGELINAYRKTDTDYGDAVIHLLTDVHFRLPSIRVAEANSRRQPTFMYLFTYRSTSTYRNYDSAHSMELPFVFGVIDDLDAIAFIGRDPQREALMKQVQQAWINFARAGDPNHPGLPEWRKYDAKTRATMELGITCRVVNDPYSRERAAWDGVPFDGVTPSVEQQSALISENGTQ